MLSLIPIIVHSPLQATCVRVHVTSPFQSPRMYNRVHPTIKHHNNIKISNIHLPLEMGVKVKKNQKLTNSNNNIGRGNELYPMEEALALSGDWHTRTDEVMLNAYLMSFDIKTNTLDSFANFMLLISSELEDDVAHFETQLSLQQGRGSAKLSPLGKLNLTPQQKHDAITFQEVLFNVSYHNSSKPPNKAQNISKGGFNIFSVLKEKMDLWSWNNLYLLLPTAPTSHGKDIQVDLQGVIDWDCVRATSQAMSTSHEATSRVKESIHGHDTFQTFTDVKKTMNEKRLRSNFECDNGMEVGAKSNIEARLHSCIELGVSTSIVRLAHLVPFVMHRLKWAIIARQLWTSVQLPHKIHVLRILEVLTTCRCQQSFNLKALEFFGDSFLKYALSCILFLKPTKHNDGALSFKRVLQSSNTKLSWLARRRGLASYIQDCHFDAKNWYAPGMLDEKQIKHKSLPNENKCVNIVGLNQSHLPSRFGKCHNLESKKLANVLKALIGVYLIEGGQAKAMEFMAWAGIIESTKFDPLQVSFVQECQSPTKMGCDYGVNLQDLEKIIGYTFHNKGLLLEAVTHSSLLVNKIDGISNYQRLEFLGDAVLDFLVSQHLYWAHPRSTPGLLRKLQSASVNNERFARIAVKHNLHTFLRCNKSNDLHRNITTFTKSLEKFGPPQELDPSKIAFGMDGLKAPKQVADLIESIAGAVLVDSRFDTNVVWDVMKPLLLPIATPNTLVMHPVSELQEICTTKGYHMNVITINKIDNTNGNISKEGDHYYAQYRYEVQLPSGVVVEGTSTNTLPRKMAQMDAAQKVLAKLQALGYMTKNCVNEMQKWQHNQQSMML